MYHYDVHGILYIQSDVQLLNDAFHEYFRVDDAVGLPEPDIVIREGGDPPDTDGLQRVDNWFYGAACADRVVYTDRLLGQREWVDLRGLTADTTRLRFETATLPTTPGSRGSIADLVESVIDYHLNWAGYTTLHAASLARDGAAVLLAGFPNVGKTLSTLALLQDGWAYMGDDNGVVGRDGTVYAYPSTSSIGYRDFLQYIEPTAIGRGRYYRHLARVWPMQSAIVERLFDYPEVYLPDIGFEQADTADARAAVVLQRGDRAVEPVGEREMAAKLLSSTDYSRPRLAQNPFLQVWAYFNPGLASRVADRERDIVRAFLDGVACYSATCDFRDWGDVLRSEVLE